MPYAFAMWKEPNPRGGTCSVHTLGCAVYVTDILFHGRGVHGSPQGVGEQKPNTPFLGAEIRRQNKGAGRAFGVSSGFTGFCIWCRLLVYPCLL